MLQIAIIVFREILEIALIVGILTAATKEIQGRIKWIISGLSLGVVASMVLAFFTDKISNSLNGLGQEVFNGMILLITALMIGSTVIWIQKHVRSFSSKFKKIGDSIRDGEKPLYVLMIVVFLSVLREGTEIALFTYSYYLDGAAISSIISGLINGILLGIILGAAIYFGLLKAFGKYFLTATNWILIFLTAGIAAQGTGFLVNAEIVPTLGNPVFDISGILSQESFLGKFFNIFFGYIDRPFGSQLMAYLGTLAFLAAGINLAKKN
jgi:high-affinity iron transporter